MKLELIPNLASEHYLHWIQVAELEKQEKSALNGCSALHWTTIQATARSSSSCNWFLAPNMTTIHPSHDRLHYRSEVNNCAIEKYTLLQEEKQKAAEETLSKGQDLSSRRKSHRDTELLLLQSWSQKAATTTRALNDETSQKMSHFPHRCLYSRCRPLCAEKKKCRGPPVSRRGHGCDQVSWWTWEPAGALGSPLLMPFITHHLMRRQDTGLPPPLH
jgi:hypothetical protein